MSPLKTSQKIGLGRLYAKKYFPKLAPEIIEQIAQTATANFMPNYSPLKREQESPFALGSGLTYEEYVINIARHWTDDEPIGVSLEWLDQIIKKGNM